MSAVVNLVVEPNYWAEEVSGVLEEVIEKADNYRGIVVVAVDQLGVCCTYVVGGPNAVTLIGGLEIAKKNLISQLKDIS